MKSQLYPWRWFVLSAAVAFFGVSVACGKKQPAAVEPGPRVVSIQGDRGGLSMAGSVGTNMRITLAEGSTTLTFDIALSQTPSSSAPQRIGNSDYTLQAMCADVYCDRVGLLLQTVTYATATAPTVTNGYAGSTSYIVGQSSKAYLFRENFQGNLEQVAVKVGTYTSIYDAMVDLGAYN
ncbi:MAG: hypothetical protein NDI61_00845 [Bdellovibrionaceae bacterium]|nr:hypothetical protein [Pseudobdellovibrionaceae bacterium]